MGRRVRRLEVGAGFGVAPAACWIHTGEQSFVHIIATGEQMPKTEYDRRWPHHSALKAYGDARMADALGDVWDDAPAPRSSADI
jgi:hypothetical protein